MLQIPSERRASDRRSTCGGRRATDLASRILELPPCPMCRESGAAELAGESDGGWWFVCLACDHLWDQRQPQEDPIKVDASFWRRLLFSRETVAARRSRGLNGAA
jgi:hypothetical protein